MGKRRSSQGVAVVLGLICLIAGVVSFVFAAHPAADWMVAPNPIGHSGGSLVVALRSEPKTLNPVLAVDASSRDVIRCLTADLIHINRETEKTEPALAKSWTVSPDHKQYVLHLRHGLQFSDGQPFTADDVIFTFQAYLDEQIHSPQRDLLIIGGKPLAVTKIDEATVRFDLSQPYAAAERIFDSLAILPKHLLKAAYESGNFAQTWGLGISPMQFAGLGPFRMKEYTPGERIVLERNPYYWKEDHDGNRLPYLDQLVFLFAPSEDAQVIRFQAGETDILSRFSAQNFSVLQPQEQSKGYHLFDLGPGLEYNFLFFNLNDLSSKNLPEIAKKQPWFQDLKFRQAVSAAVDREGIVRLVYGGRAMPLWWNVTPGNKLWLASAIPRPARSLDRARELLKSIRFSWKGDGTLIDPYGAPVEFSILTSASNAQRVKIATIVQDDLSQLGMDVHVVPLDFGAVVDRFMKSYDYEAAVMGLTDGDADPTPEMNVWLSNGSTHLWHLNETKPATLWEAELDHLMQQQLITVDYRARKKLYDRVQQIVAEDLPVICVVSPNILVGAKDRVGNFEPAALDPYALWNVEQLYIR